MIVFEIMTGVDNQSILPELTMMVVMVMMTVIIAVDDSDISALYIGHPANISRCELAAVSEKDSMLWTDVSTTQTALTTPRSHPTPHHPHPTQDKTTRSTFIRVVALFIISS